MVAVKNAEKCAAVQIILKRRKNRLTYRRKFNSFNKPLILAPSIFQNLSNGHFSLGKTTFGGKLHIFFCLFAGDLRLWVYIDTKSSGNCVCVVVKPSMTAMEMTKQVIAEKSLNDNLVLHEVVLGGALQRPIHHSELVLDVTLKWGSWCEQDRRDNYLLLKRNILYEEAVQVASPPMSVFGEALYSDLKMKSFKKYNFSMSNARLTISKSEDTEVASWPIEDISWYFGCEPKRHSPYSFNVTFIHRQEAVLRSKDRPHFGRTISFESREFYIKWIAAMLVAEFANDIKPKIELTNIPTNEKLLLIDD